MKFFSKPVLLAFSIFVVFSLYITYPLIFNLTTITTGKGDEMLIAWIHNWNINSILRGNILNIFDANIFYPYHNSLAYSDTFFTSSIIVLFPFLILKEPIVTINIALITSLFLLGFSVFLLSYYLTKDFLTAFLGGILIQFSPAILDKTVHLQILAIYWIPFSILFFLLFVETKRYRFLLLSCTMFLLQTYNSFLPGYFLIAFYVTYFITLFFLNKKLFTHVFTKKYLLTISVTLLLLLPIIIPYYQVAHTYNETRDIREAIHLALQPEDFLVAHDTSRLRVFLENIENPQKYKAGTEIKPAFFGGVFLLLFFITLYFVPHFFKKKDFLFITFFSTSLVGLILSLGPALHFQRVTIHTPFPIILPYTILYYFAPGFKGFRNSSRWEMLFLICLVICISFMLRYTLRKFSLLKKIIIIFLLTIIVIAEFNFPLRFVTIPTKNNFPQVHTWLNTTPPQSTYIQLPIYNWNMFPYASEELIRDFYTTLHFRKSVNGASGFSPKPWQTTIEQLLHTFPDTQSLFILKTMDIDYIIVEKDEYDMLHNANFKVNNKLLPSGTEITTELQKSNKVKLIKTIHNTYIYSLQE